MLTNYCFGKAKQVIQSIVKNIMQCPLNFLKPPYKYTNNSYTSKKQQLLQLQLRKKNIFCILQVGGLWNSKSKNFVSLTAQNFCFLMACFNTIVLITYFEENKVKVHSFEVPVFAVLLTEPLSFYVSDCDRKIKQQFTVIINKKPDILFNIYSIFKR